MPPDPSHVHGTAGKLAQLIGEVIVHHAPWSSEVSEQTRRRVTDAWLEGLEAHASEVVGPVVDKVLSSSDMPAEIAQLFEHAARPTAQFGSTIQQFFVYGVMFSLASTALAPFTQIVANDLWKANPTRPLAPPDIATMVVRGITPGQTATTPAPAWATDEAAKSGVPAADFQAIVDATGQPPAPQDLYQMIRRGIISEEQLAQGIREGDSRDEWIPFITQLRYTQPSPIDMVRAAVQGEMTYDEAAAWATKLGLEPPGYLDGNPDWFRLLYETAGRPPGPVEMAHAALRGFVPFTGTGPDSVSFAQAISESDIKDKYVPVLQALAAYFPPVGEVRTLLERGGITADQAVTLWQQAGVPPELSQAFLHLAEYEQVTTDKAVAKGDILTLVLEGILSDATAADMLARLGFGPDASTFLVQMAHARYDLQSLRAAVRKVEGLYTTHKIDAVVASKALSDLGMPADQAKAIMTTLTTQRDNQVVIPTAAQVEAAFHYGVIDQGTAMTMLEQRGYSDWDAWFVLSAHEHGALPDEPARPASLSHG